MTKDVTSTNSGNSGTPSQPPESRKRYTLKKAERLSRKKAFEILFEKGTAFHEGPLRFFYVFDLPETEVTAPLMMAVSAPKRKFRRANVRNFYKRRLREAYRLHKHPLLDGLITKNRNLAFLVTYNSRKSGNFHQIERAMVAGLRRLEKLV